MVDDVFVDTFVIGATKGPGSQLIVLLTQRIQDDAILLGKVRARCGNRIANAALGLARDHQRIGRDLARIQLCEQFDIASQDAFVLAAETKDHIDIECREQFLCILDAFEDLLTATKLFVTFSHL